MVDYVLALYDGPTRLEQDLVLGVDGYPVAIATDEFGVDLELENTPPEEPPTGRLLAELGPGTLVEIGFEPEGGIVTDGVVVQLDVPLRMFLDLERRGRHVVQLGDTIKLRLRCVDRGVPANISTATSLEMVLRRADGSALVRAAQFATDGVDGLVDYQFQLGEIQSAGDWAAQARAVMPGGAEYKSAPRSFEVLHNLPTS